MISNDFLIINFVVVLLGLIGGYVGLRYSMSRAKLDIQTKIREDLTAENALLRSKISDLEKDNRQLKDDNRQLQREMQLVFMALRKSYDLEVDIDNGMVTIRDRKNHTIYTVQADTPQAPNQ